MPDEDQLIAQPLEPPTPRRQTDAELNIARLARTHTREDIYRAVLIGLIGMLVGASLVQLIILNLR
jgi:hypothetical protein